MNNLKNKDNYSRYKKILKEFEKSKTRYDINKAMNNIILRTTKSGSKYYKFKLDYKINKYDIECLDKF